jgi:Holliday junction DNA helicase RuvA
MIAKLRGILDSLGTDWCIIDVGGVGYSVFCSSRTLGNLNGIGEETTLMIDTHIREDHFHLFGFATELERDWFRLLQTVQGVGAKVALAILSACSTDELSSSIAAQDKTTVSRANGVGPKVAMRIVNELKDKVAKFAFAPSVTPTKGHGSAVPAGVSGNVGDAVSALVNLGYKQVDAFVAVNTALRDSGNDDLQNLITLGLKELSQ